MIAVIGADGQLGTDLCRQLRGKDFVPLTHRDIEVANMSSVEAALGKHRPDVIINCAAYVRVDDCETNVDKAFCVNALGARNAAVVAENLGARLVHVSTDYVFGGEKETRTAPYTEFDVPNPPNVYGKSKLAGENLVKHLCRRYFIVRASALFGVAGASGKGGNFIETMVKLARERGEVRVVRDQVFSPTYTKDLARKILQLASTNYYGIFHVTNQGACSWHEFASEIIRLAGIEARVVAITTAGYPTPARRPAFSVLDNYHLKLLGLYDMRPWQEALKEYMEEKGHLRQ